MDQNEPQSRTHQETQQNQSSSSTDNKSKSPDLDPLAKFLRNILTGQLNPLPI